mgnify:CR=1 FL=1
MEKQPKFRYYYPRKLVNGDVIGLTGLFVAIPRRHDTKRRILVVYQDKAMMVEDWFKGVTYRRFPDKWGRGTYTVGYFTWNPS